jgi:hypothetical protein
MAFNLKLAEKELLTMPESQNYISQNLETWGLKGPPTHETLKSAARQGRLFAIKKGGMWFTTTQELDKYLRHYDPKNRTLSKPRKTKKREKKGQNDGNLEAETHV